MLVLQELLTYVFLHPMIREKGGAYGSGCAADGSGLISLYSYRDPNCDATFDNFEKAIGELIEGKFNERELVEAKLLAFQKLDKVLEPSLRGLGQFTRGTTDEEKMKLRLLALDVSKENICFVAQRYMMEAIEQGKTSRVVFGSQNADFDVLEKSGWSIFNPIDFLSHSYFDAYNKDTNK
jgi:presequence protease